MESKGKKYYNAQQQILVNKEDIEELQTLTKTHTSQIDTLEKAIVSGYKYLELELTQKDDNTFTGTLTEEQIATLESGVPIGFYAHLMVKSVDVVQIFLTQYSKEAEETEEGEIITYYKYTGYRDGVNYTALINLSDLSITFSGVVAELDYDELSNKPTINSIEISGSKTFIDYKLNESMEGSDNISVDLNEAGDKVIVKLDEDFVTRVENIEGNIERLKTDKQDALTGESEISVKSINVGGVDLDYDTLDKLNTQVTTNKEDIATEKTNREKAISAEATRVDEKYSVQTSAPESAIEDNGIHIVHLASEPETKYDGYIYLIDEE